MRSYAVVGLGYVGLGLATALSKKNKVVGYDINETRIKELSQHHDRNGLVTTKDLSHPNISFTGSLQQIEHANFYIISVPTPTIFNEIPDLSLLMEASKQIASIIKKGDIIVFESTVYPGTTEDVCIPILEKYSELTCGKDFNVGYSPERICPGAKKHTLKTITKVISAQNEKTLKVIHETYKKICDTIYPVSKIPVAESVKIFENTQRDVNIALMNEFAKIAHELNLDMHEIIEGCKTKFDFAPFKPGFVGGHCISVDPHYLAFQAKRLGVNPELIQTARKVNDSMTQYVIQSMLKLLITNKISIDNLTVGVFGITYKENVVDTRNSLAFKLISELREYGFKCHVHDPLVKESPSSFNLELFGSFKNLSVAIVVVGHDFYRDKLKEILGLCREPQVLMDIPTLFINEAKSHKNLIYWGL